MKPKTAFYLIALALIAGVILILAIYVPSSKPAASRNGNDGLTYDEHLRISPPAPENFQGRYSNGSVALRWDAPVPVTIPHDYSDTITGYSVYRGTASDPVTFYAETRDLKFTDSEITGNARYVYSVRAVHEGNVESDPTGVIIVQSVSEGGVEGLSFEEYLKTTPPPPRNLAGTRSGDRITLRWDAPEPVPSPHDYNDTIVGYRIYRGTTPETLSLYATTKDRIFTDSAITGSTTFTYEVTVLVGGDMESSPCEEITVKMTR